MAKAKLTKKYNVQVTMTEQQWIAVNAVLANVRLGSHNYNTEILSDLVCDLDGFNKIYEESFLDLANRVGHTIEDGYLTIELRD